MRLKIIKMILKLLLFAAILVILVFGVPRLITAITSDPVFSRIRAALFLMALRSISSQVE